MFGSKKIIERLDNIESALARLTDLVNADQRLEKQNDKLMDRLMSKDFSSYAVHSPDVLNRLETTSQPVEPSPLEDEGNIGEVLSDEEIGQ